jgi:hypothetical protein
MVADERRLDGEDASRGRLDRFAGFTPDGDATSEAINVVVPKTRLSGENLRVRGSILRHDPDLGLGPCPDLVGLEAEVLVVGHS